MRDRHTAGFSCVETLIALLLLAAGAAAFAALQIYSLQVALEAERRGAALLLAGELADWLRAGVQAHGSVPALDAPSAAADEAACYDGACTPPQMASFELAHWWRRLLASVPEARLVACRDAQYWNGGPRAWRWECSEGGPAAAPLALKLGWPARAGGQPVPRLVLPVGSLPE